ncbi:MAG: N-acetylmuramoyl-L-alanine amidase [Luteolibacter sp.]
MRAILFVLALFVARTGAAEKVIVIDPGHGGSTDSGSQKERTLSSSNNATSPAKLLEKDLTLELSKEVAKQLAARPHTVLKPVLTRTGDENPDFGKRAAFCAAAKPVAIFSIHFNASDNHAALGTTAVIAAKGTNPNHAVDEAFAKGLITAAHGAVVRFVPRSVPLPVIPDSHLHGGAGSNFFHQLAKHPELANVPKCFLEIEFIDRKDVDAELLSNRKAAFPVIAKAITDYLAARFE